MRKTFRAAVFSLLAIFRGMPAPEAQELWLSCGGGTGVPLGEFGTICSADIDGMIGLDAAGLFGIPLEAGLDILYAGSLPVDTWVRAMNGVSGIVSAGYHISFGNRFFLTPRAGGGVRFLFASSALDVEDFTAGTYTDRWGVQALVKAGVEAGFLPAESWSIGVGVDYLMTIEADGLIHGITAAVSLGRRIGVRTVPVRAALRNVPSAVPPAVVRAEKLAETLSPLEETGNIRILLSGGTVTVIIEDSFNADESEPTERTREQVRLIADLIRGAPIRGIVIRGYVAEAGDGDESQDRQLSLYRAMSVRELLAVQEVLAGPGGMEIAGFGSGDPVGDNSTPEGRARNRRVEIVIDMAEEEGE